MQILTFPNDFLRHPNDQEKNQSASEGWLEISKAFLFGKRNL